MSDGKGKLPTDSSPAEVDEGWDALDEAIEAAASTKGPAAAAPVPPAPARPAPTAPPAPPAATPEPQVLSLSDRGKTDPENKAVRPEDLAGAPADSEFEMGVPTAKHLPRDLPSAPPGERRVAKTIMGVGTPELQAALKLRLKGTPEPETPPPTPPSPPRPVATPAKAAPATPTGPSASAAASATPAPGAPPASASPRPSALADTDEVAALASNPSDEVPPISALASTSPLSSPDPLPPVVSFAETSPAIEPHTVRMRPGGAPAVTPTAATRRTQPERRTGQGPSNLALVLLWTVALISVGLALYLYFARS